MRLPLLIHLSNPAAALRAGSAPSFRELRLTPGSHPGRQRGRTRENPWKVRFRPARPVPEGLALSEVTEAAGPAVPCGLRDPRRRGFAHLPGQRSSDMLRERSARQAPLVKTESIDPEAGRRAGAAAPRGRWSSGKLTNAWALDALPSHTQLRGQKTEPWWSQGASGQPLCNHRPITQRQGPELSFRKSSFKKKIVQQKFWPDKSAVTHHSDPVHRFSPGRSMNKFKEWETMTFRGKIRVQSYDTYSKMSNCQPKN